MSDELGFRDPSDPRRRRSRTPTTGARAVPIYQTTSLPVPRHRARRQPVRAGRDRQHLHADHEPDPGGVRGPHRRLEGGVATASASRRTGGGSGQAAETLAILNLAEAGDHIVSSACALRRHLQPVPLHAAQAGHRGHRSSTTPTTSTQWRAAIRPNTKAFFGETLGNPKNDVLDLEGVAGVAHERRHPARSSTTRCRRRTCIRPLEWGADIVVHSATKFIGGHGTSIGGVIVDGGTFDFGAGGRFPSFTEPDPSYHGLPYWPALGTGLLHHQGPRAAAARHRRRHLAVQRVPVPAGPRDAAPAHGAPRRQRPGGRRVPRGPRRGRVGQVRRPAQSSPWYERAQKYSAGRGAGSVLAFVIKGGADAGKRVRRGARAAQPRGQHRRRAQPGHPPGDAPPTASSPPRSSSRPASGPGSCACPSGSSRSTTSSPTSRPGSAPPSRLRPARRRPPAVGLRRPPPLRVPLEQRIHRVQHRRRRGPPPAQRPVPGRDLVVTALGTSGSAFAHLQRHCIGKCLPRRSVGDGVAVEVHERVQLGQGLAAVPREDRQARGPQPPSVEADRDPRSWAGGAAPPAVGVGGR